MVAWDGFSAFLTILFALSGLFGIALAHGYNTRMGIQRGEYYTFILFSVTGMMLMAQAANLIVVFLALELLSIPLYILSAFAVPKVESEEAGLKYFLLGAFSTGFVVYGIALVYGATASTELAAIVAALSAGTANLTLLLLGAALILVGFGFKVAAVPFHMWTPDVYQGAPTAVTGFMSAGAKAAGFAALLRVFITAFPAIAADITPVITALSVLTMFVGNVIAIAQTNIKRMLAYSSIAQAGYILLAFLPYGNADIAGTSIAAAVFYLFAYVLANFGAWAVVIALEQAGGNPSTGSGQGLEIADFAGLARKKPAMAAAMAVFMLSLTGMPPTLGLVGKIYLFRAALDGGFVIPAVIGVLTSLISAYYYLRVIITMYMREGDPQVNSDWWINFTWGATALLTVILSFVPQFIFNWVQTAAMKLF
jgi:NADH-quinone oxidoreductase subunit N